MQYCDDRILIVAPTGRDALNAAEVLSGERIEGLVCQDIPQMCAVAEEGAGALLLTHESLTRTSLASLSSLLERQPPWSDLPLIVLTSGGDATTRGVSFLRDLGPNSAVTVLERPLRRIMLVSAARAALRARRRQCEVRDLWRLRDSMFTELQQRAANLEASQRELLRAKETISRHAAELEQTVQERTARLLETNGQLEAFSYSISHDMRGPLRAMQQYAQILLEEQEGIDAQGREYLERVSRAASRLDRLIQDVLLYSRATRAEISLDEVNLDKLVQEIVQQYPGFKAPRARIHVERPLSPVIAHEASLTQCISNLLSNAVKFVPAGKVPEVRVCTVRVNGSVRIWIEDNGIGIAPKNHERIFNIFERVHGPSDYDGTGIGLSIVKKTVERMGGGVGLQSELGKGTRFWLELPYSHSK
jgi:signal transduction histidine kinase